MKTIQKVLVRSMEILYEREKTKVKIDSEWSDKLEIQHIMCKGCVLLPFDFPLVFGLVTQLAR